MIKTKSNYAILYQIVNKITKEAYVGVTTISINKRWSVHLYKLRRNKATSKLQVAFNKYGEDYFYIESILEGDKVEMFLAEKEMTKVTVLNGYNTIVGGNDIEERRSSSMIGHQKMASDPIYREMIGKKISEKRKGCTASQETKDKMSKAKNGVVWSEEQKKARKELWGVRGHSCIGRFRWYLNLQTGIYYNTPEMYEMFNTTKSGLKNKFKQNHVEIFNFIKA